MLRSLLLALTLLVAASVSAVAEQTAGILREQRFADTHLGELILNHVRSSPAR
jgi:hypothetical protein